MITGYVKGRVELKRYNHRWLFMDHPGHVASYTTLKELMIIKQLGFTEVIPQVGDVMSVQGDKKAKVVQIDWIDGTNINIITDYVIEVLEDDETEASKIEAEQKLEEWGEKIKEIEEKRRKLWEPKEAPVEAPKKKGWFW